MPSLADLVALGGTYQLGDRTVHRIGYGAMRLSGPGIYGPPENIDEARAVLRTAIEAGVDHIDTSDFYGPHVTNQLIRETLSPYPENLVLVTKIGARRTPDKAWLPAMSREEIVSAVHDNLRNLGVDVLDVVNLRGMGDIHGPSEGSIAEQFTILAELQQQGLIRHLGVSNVTAAQLEEARKIAPVVCVQNNYNVVNRADDLLVDHCAQHGIAFVPFFPLGGFQPLQEASLHAVAKVLQATPMQVALSWLLHRSPNMLLIPGTSSVAHLKENLAAATIALPGDVLQALEDMSKGLPPA